MKILYIGCVESSYVFLEALIRNGAEIAGVITKENSAFNSDFADLTPLCRTNHIPYYFVRNINDADAVQFITEAGAEIGFCFGWSQLVKDYVIDMFPLGMVGYHPAALPENRGRHPIIWALALGLEKTASTFFRIEKTADTGDILSQTEVGITYEDTAGTLMKKLLDAGSVQIVRLCGELERGTVKAVSQKNCKGNTWRKRGRFDGQIDWRMSSSAIYNLVRALTRPYVGAHFMRNGEEIKVWSVREVMSDGYRNIEPGKIVCVTPESFTVKAGDYLVEVLECDPVEVSAGEYLM